MNYLITSGILGAVALGGVYGADVNQNPYVDKGDFYELAITSDIPQGERVEIHKDKAQLDLVGWNDEYRISIKPQIPTTKLGATEKDFKVEANRPLLSKRMEWKSDTVTAFIEPKEGTENEFDIDFTLDSKPDTNVFEYKIEGADEFDFFFQAPLTQEEIAEGASRPENVEGSYAVYHSTKANHRVGSTNYATGKVMHIYRPKVIDANGSEVWAELNYDNGTLSVTVPQKFLDDAVYPVRVDPTFGYETIGSSTQSLGFRPASWFTSPADVGQITSMTAAVNISGAGGPTEIQLAIFAYVSDGDVGALVDYSDGEYSTSTVANTWLLPEIAMTLSATLSPSTKYFLNVWGNTGQSTINAKYDAGTGLGVLNTSGLPAYSTGDWPDPYADETAVDRKYSIYATYTASAVASPPPQSDYPIIMQ